ncbi:MAG: hypothetical protein JWL91_2665 [Sphingomonas bacterium]|nr:DUF72 domain-containing protein [Sphingomonas bacterium]MDB5690789.1 hypothetical protein [Sphingomonas bacterium]
MAGGGTIRVGIGGWTYAPWRGTFYPPGLPHARELEYAAAHVSAIEINATGYRLQSRESFARWGRAVPDGFVFAIKASRFCTNRKVLGEAGESIAKFVAQGFTELGDRLGPILWQFAATKRFDPDDFAAFLALLPSAHDGVTLRHAIEPRHESFRDAAFVAMARAAGVAIVFADSPDYPVIPDLSGDFVYARLQDQREEEAAGYAPLALDRWAETARAWACGAAPAGLPYVVPAAMEQPRPAGPRNVFVFMINGAKVRAPAAAMALAERLRG